MTDEMYHLTQCPKCKWMTLVSDLGMCDNCTQIVYRNKRSKATILVCQAIATGQLTRPAICELCGQIPDSSAKHPIRGHHWRGYEDDAVLDIWWICVSCNSKLAGPHFHNGSITKAQARELIETRQYLIYRQ